MAGRDVPNMTAAELDEFFRLVSEEHLRTATAMKRLGRSPQAAYNRERRNPEFGERLNKAKAEGERTITRLLVERAKAGDSDAIKFLLKHLYKWMTPLEEEKVREMRAAAEAAKKSADAAKPTASVELWKQAAATLPLPDFADGAQSAPTEPEPAAAPAAEGDEAAEVTET